MNYKKEEFDLGKALNGKDVVTRSDKQVKIIYNGKAKDRCRLAGWVDDDLLTWNEDGTFLPNKESSFDLFILEPNDNVGFINIHEDSKGKWVDERIYDYYETALDFGKDSPTYKGTIEIICPS